MKKSKIETGLLCASAFMAGVWVGIKIAKKATGGK